jgi:hypothetical protein
MTVRSRRIQPGQSKSESIRVGRQSRARTLENLNRSHPTESDRIKPLEMGCTSSKSEFLRVLSSRCEFLFFFGYVETRGRLRPILTCFEECGASVTGSQAQSKSVKPILDSGPTWSDQIRPEQQANHSGRVGVAKRVCHRKFTKPTRNRACQSRRLRKNGDEEDEARSNQ